MYCHKRLALSFWDRDIWSAELQCEKTGNTGFLWWKDHLEIETSQGSLSYSSHQLSEYHLGMRSLWDDSRLINVWLQVHKRPWARNISWVQSTPKTMRHNSSKWQLVFYSTNFGVVGYIETVCRTLMSPFIKLEIMDAPCPSPGPSLICYSLFLSHLILPITLSSIYMLWCLIVCVNWTVTWGTRHYSGYVCESIFEWDSHFNEQTE